VGKGVPRVKGGGIAIMPLCLEIAERRRLVPQ